MWNLTHTDLAQDLPMSPKDDIVNELPMLHTWMHFMEAYGNHMHQFLSRSNVVFMEIGVQSGGVGKIPILHDYFWTCIDLCEH